MTLLEMLLILIGVGILIFSCFLVDKSSKKGEGFVLTDYEASKSELSDEDIFIIKQKIDKMASEISEETITKTEDQLSQLSNEKIIAVNDFSKQVIDKISQNHEEVVFLYNMLNEKETELKNTMKQVDSTKKRIVDTKINDSKTIKSKESKDSVKKSTPEIDLKEMIQPVSTQSKPLDEMGDNYNEKILELYSQGKSIIEISKYLDLGQGEVKLVIDLFKEK